MTSEFGYCTLADLECLMAKDFSTISALYTDSVIEAKISQAERLINSILGTSLTTATSTVKAATLQAASDMMTNQLIKDKFIPNDSNQSEKALDKIISDARTILDLDTSRTKTVGGWNIY